MDTVDMANAEFAKLIEGTCDKVYRTVRNRLVDRGAFDAGTAIWLYGFEQGCKLVSAMVEAGVPEGVEPSLSDLTELICLDDVNEVLVADALATKAMEVYRV